MRLPLQLFLCLVLGLFALALRLPNLQTVPALTDEFQEVGWAVSIVKQNHLPLVAFDAYDGPLFPYLLAGVFRLFGTSPGLPRALVLVTGALTVPALYWFAREQGRDLGLSTTAAGLVAAALLAVNAHHILFNSHVAWSNDTTPLFTTLALSAYTRALRLWHAGWLAASGALYGLALQTHPSALALAPALLIHFAAFPRTRAWLKRPAPYLAFAAALVAYSPVLYYNLSTHFASLATASEAGYAFETAPTLEKFFAHLAPALGDTARIAFGSFQSVREDLPWIDLPTLAFWVLTIFALVWLARRAAPSHPPRALPLISVLAGVAFLAAFNRFYALPDSARYFQFLLPLIFTAWSLLFVHLWQVAPLAAPLAGRARLRLARAVLAVILLTTLSFPLVSLSRYYQEMLTTGQSNVILLTMVSRVTSGDPAPVLLEWRLAGLRTKRGGNIGDGLAYYLGLAGTPPVLVSTGTPRDLGGLQNYLRDHPSAYLVAYPAAPRELGDEFPLQPLVAGHFPCPSCGGGEDYALLHWTNGKP